MLRFRFLAGVEVFEGLVLIAMVLVMMKTCESSNIVHHTKPTLGTPKLNYGHGSRMTHVACG